MAGLVFFFKIFSLCVSCIVFLRSAHLQMSQIQNIFTNFTYILNQNITQKYTIFSDEQKSSKRESSVRFRFRNIFISLNYQLG